MDFARFCRDNSIEIAPIGHKHHRNGWINISCPFCGGGTGFPLGCTGFFFTCYRCGEKGKVARLICQLLGCGYRESLSIVEDYGGALHSPLWERKPAQYRLQTNIKPPCALESLGPSAIRYLEKRGFTGHFLASQWHISQTSLIGEYNGRIFIPIYYKGFMISYTCRSYVNSKLKYLSCSAQNEAIPHKHILYGIDNIPDRKNVVVVEGCFDVWRLGYGAVATFGTKVTSWQKNILMEFDHITLLADGDDAGYRAWHNLALELKNNGKKVKLFQLEQGKDAADLSEDEALEFMAKVPFFH